MKPTIYVQSDYAGIGAKNFSAYYGYEKTQNEEWCFEATFQETGKEQKTTIVIPFSKLGCSDMFNVGICLLTGVAWLFQKYKISE